MTDMNELARRARTAEETLSGASLTERNGALASIAGALRKSVSDILSANARDLETAKAAGQTSAFLDRLSLTEARIEAMARGVEDIARLPDPVGLVAGGGTLENGIRMFKTKVPFGVVGMIYEARPNVTVDAAALCLKSANAAILRGSREAICSNMALCSIVRSALSATSLPEDCVLLVEDVSRESATAMMTLKGGLDLLIPRGGASLIRSVVDNATVPVIETGTGNCHVFVDESADLEMAVRIVDNAKTSRPSVCNALETLLVHEGIAEKFLPVMKAALDRFGVEWRGCEKTAAILPGIKPATEEDYFTEFVDYILAVKIVSGLDEAIRHIAKYSSGHSECIITESYESSQVFTARVDAAAVYVNASTRFTDGSVFGLGAEIGISTQKLHTRGPMGLTALTTDKYILFGGGQIRS